MVLHKVVWYLDDFSFFMIQLDFSAWIGHFNSTAIEESFTVLLKQISRVFIYRIVYHKEDYLLTMVMNHVFLFSLSYVLIDRLTIFFLLSEPITFCVYIFRQKKLCDIPE